MIKNAESYYYIAVTPTSPNEVNNTGFRELVKKLGLMPEENTYLCHWEDIKQFFDSIKASEVKETFDYNCGQIY